LLGATLNTPLDISNYVFEAPAFDPASYKPDNAVTAVSVTPLGDLHSRYYTALPL
jgi:hypothetical protein